MPIIGSLNRDDAIEAAKIKSDADELRDNQTAENTKSLLNEIRLLNKMFAQGLGETFTIDDIEVCE